MMVSEVELRKAFFSNFFLSLERRGANYVIVGPVDEFPDSFASDIDFVVNKADAAIVYDALIAAGAGGWSLVQIIRHEVDACYFVYSATLEGQIFWMELDVSFDYRRRGRLWMRSADLLRNRRQHPRGFWVPGAADAFQYYVIKKLDKGSIDARQAACLAGWVGEDPDGCARVAQSLLGAAGWQSLRAGLLAGNAAAGTASTSMTELTAILRQRAAQEGGLARGLARMRDLWRMAGRVLRPTGLVVAVLGPDGVGKSTVIAALQRELQPAFRRVAYRHLRPRVLRRGQAAPSEITNPHGTAKRGWAASLAKLGLFVADSVLGEWLSIRPLKIQSSLVIFDRYPHDMLADPRRYGLATPRWLNASVLGLVPKPDLWLILDAPVTVIMARKQEITAESCATVRAGYRALAEALPNARIIDTTGGIDDSVGRAFDAVLSALASRTARRTHVMDGVA
jgi:thymidylate kinase